MSDMNQPSNPDEVAVEEQTSTDVEHSGTPEGRPRVKRKPTPTPFDHPLSFPILVGLFALWFGYDGWFNPKTKSIIFNRVMFGICGLACVWTMRIGLREMRILRERKAKKAAQQADANASETN